MIKSMKEQQVEEKTGGFVWRLLFSRPNRKDDYLDIFRIILHLIKTLIFGAIFFFLGFSGLFALDYCSNKQFDVINGNCKVYQATVLSHSDPYVAGRSSGGGSATIHIESTDRTYKIEYFGNDKNLVDGNIYSVYEYEGIYAFSMHDLSMISLKYYRILDFLCRIEFIFLLPDILLFVALMLDILALIAEPFICIRRLVNGNQHKKKL